MKARALDRSPGPTRNVPLFAFSSSPGVLVQGPVGANAAGLQEPGCPLGLRTDKEPGVSSQADPPPLVLPEPYFTNESRQACDLR